MADDTHTNEPDLIKDPDLEGWNQVPLHDGYVNLIGPYYVKTNDLGHTQTAFRAQARHLNGGGSVHGGCLLSLADTALYLIAYPRLEGSHVVTLQLDSQFISPGREGDIIIASGEVIRAGASVVFVKGQLQAQDRVILTFSGILKRIKPKV
jgi:acyl-coenzyme A thioesterase 13